MSVEAVLSSREEIANKIIYNIRNYGLPDGKEPLAERPYNDFSRLKYPFTGANYLRVLASKEQDPRWYKLSDAKRFGLRVRKDAETIELESWTHLDKGIRHASAKLEKYVNARYVMDLPPREKLPLDCGESMDKAVRLLRCAEETAKNREFSFPEGKENLYYRFVNASSHLLGEEIKERDAAKRLAPTLTAYLAFKTAGLSMDYRQPLFSDTQLELLEGEQGAKDLFRAMGKASSILNRLQTAELTLLDEYAHEGRGEYFKDLRITLFYSEADELTGRGVHNEHLGEMPAGVHNEHFFRPGVYKQEAAYELLSAMLQADKERWEKNLGRHDGFGRTKISVECGDFQLNEAVINLGRLELANKKTAIRALGHRLPKEAQKELDDEEGLRLHLFRYDRTLEENRAAVVERKQELETFIKECDTVKRTLRRDERRYLREHEDMQEDMEKTAPTYLYYFSNLSSLSGEPHIAKNALEIHYDLKEFQTGHVRFYNGRKVVDMPSSSGIIVESAWPLRTEVGRSVYTEKEAQDYERLNRFSIAYREEGKPFTKEMPVVRGEKAMELFISHKLEDAIMACTEKHPQEYEVGVKLEFRYDDQPFYSIRYMEGSGELNHKLPVGMPHLENQQEDKEFQKAVHTWAKYHNENRLAACTMLYSRSWVPIIERREQKKLALEQTHGKANTKINIQRVAEQKTAGLGR